MHRLYSYDIATGRSAKSRLQQFLPYRVTRATLAADLNASLVVAVVIVPSAMAYAVLAGLPAHVGLYASILPLLLYALVGLNRAISVGPVTIVSLMTASTLGQIAAPGSLEYLAAAATLALLSAAFLGLAAWLRLGRYVHVLKHSALAGFLVAVGLVIACSQIKHLLGVSLPAATFAPTHIFHAALRIADWNLATTALGLAALASLIWRGQLVAHAVAKGALAAHRAPGVARAMPLLVVAAALLAVSYLRVDTRAGVAVVGPLPGAVPSFSAPALGIEFWSVLVPGAILMSLVGFLECVGVVKGLEAKGAGRLDFDRELGALAAANLGAAITGGYPVSGGTVRSVVNFNAGAATPLANGFTALIVLATVALFGDWLARLPMTILAAIVIAAALSIIDIAALRGVGQSPPERVRFLATLATTVCLSPEAGIAVGITTSVTPDQRLEWAYQTAAGIPAHLSTWLRAIWSRSSGANLR